MPLPPNDLPQSAALDLAAFDYHLPPESIAQQPCLPRDQARLFVYRRSSGEVTHARVCDLPAFLDAGDLIVANASRVVPARLRGKKLSGGAAEALLLKKMEGSRNRYRALVGCRGRLRIGQRFQFQGHFDLVDSTQKCAVSSTSLSAPTSTPLAVPQMEATLIELGERGEVVLEFDTLLSPYTIGEMPLPPYIRRATAQHADLEHYQTIFARKLAQSAQENVEGSVAAPTAGLHFTDAVLRELDAKAIVREEVLLHVGPGTFRPLNSEILQRGELHEESFEISPRTADAVAYAHQKDRRVVAVGTTTTRVLETQALDGGLVRAGCGATRIFLYPGYRFRVIDALFTNFHLPRSSLLLLVTAFAGREEILDCYAQAIRSGYRFYSYGDAMLIL